MGKSLPVLLGFVSGLCLISCRQNSPGSEFSMDKIFYYAIQEDVSKIIGSINSISEDSLSPDQRELKEKYNSRFLSRTENFDFKTNDSLIINVLTIFHKYWTDVLMKKESPGNSERKYISCLFDLVNSNYRFQCKNPGIPVNGNNLRSVFIKSSPAKRIFYTD